MKKYVGILCGIVSAVSYGTNPLFGVPLLRVGYGVESMLFFRFLGAAVLLLPFAFYFGRGLRTTRSEAGVLFFVGVLFAVSSLALYESFKLMPAGIASAILFLYPVFTALIMGVFFKAPIGCDGGNCGVFLRNTAACGLARRERIGFWYRACGAVGAVVFDVHGRFKSHAPCGYVRAKGCVLLAPLFGRCVCDLFCGARRTAANT